MGGYSQCFIDHKTVTFTTTTTTTTTITAAATIKKQDRHPRTVMACSSVRPASPKKASLIFFKSFSHRLTIILIKELSSVPGPDKVFCSWRAKCSNLPLTQRTETSTGQHPREKGLDNNEQKWKLTGTTKHPNDGTPKRWNTQTMEHPNDGTPKRWNTQTMEEGSQTSDPSYNA